MIKATNLGYPRIGVDRELKWALEAYWTGDLSAEALQERCRDLRVQHWMLQQDLGLDHIPSGDFSLYDHVLDTAAMVGAVPRRFGFSGSEVDLEAYFAMARGVQEKDVDTIDGGAGVPAMEMTKWFDTNYHYIVPEFEAGQSFYLASTQVIDQFEEARQVGIHTRPVLVGPVSFLLLGKAQYDEFKPLDLLGDLLPVYTEVLCRLSDTGADWVQLDEPFLALDLTADEREAFERAYGQLAAATDLRLLVATYFEGLADNMKTVLHLPVVAVHLDLVRAPEQLDEALRQVPDDKALSLGVIDGRNVWRAELDAVKATVEKAVEALGAERILIGPSCSLLHVPVDLDTEPDLDNEARSWLAFARQKIEEIVALGRTVNEVGEAGRAFEASRNARKSRRTSKRIHRETVKKRATGVGEDMLQRRSEHERRRIVQQEHLRLPTLPTTTIGSFPQTKEVRAARSAFRKGDTSREEYEQFIEQEIARTVYKQEVLDLDVLVHGESERSDMVEYFGQKMEGFLFTRSGWVQSYGSRCVRPPIIYGDVIRLEPMTVRWSRYAQSLTDRPVKGMLTGPVTILQWSFVRDDQPHAQTCRQIALAVREEVADLEEAGISVIQIDEPALREGLPLRRRDQRSYLDWATECFRLASSGAADATQIHTHMCYAEFGDILPAIAAMDADVISIESSRSKMELLHAFAAFDYPNEVGPGVYDIHSPRVPPVKEIEELLEKALRVLDADQLWVNPDCGLKTRRWEEVEPALEHMVQAARRVRRRLGESPAGAGARAKV